MSSPADMPNANIAAPPEFAAHPLSSMFAPKGIAIVGASDRSGWSRYTLANLRQAGYPHPIHLINQKGGTAHGELVKQSLRDIEDQLELAYILTGPASLPSVMAEAAECGIRNAVVIAAGFGEMGAKGVQRERELAARAADLGLRLLGPNNLGYINTAAHTAPWSQMMPWPLEAGGVGVLSQSGALGIFLLNYLQSRDVAISHLVTLGNEADITVAEGIDYLLTQPQTQVIALYLESVRHPDVFIDAAQRALAAGKPIVAYKAGRGSVGAKVAAAHTGSIAGDDAVFDAVFRQYGVIRVDTIEDMVTTAGLLDAYGEMPGRRVGFVTGSGAMCGVIGDVSEHSGLVLPDLAPETVSALYAGGLPDFATAQNPLDTTGYVVIDPELLPMSEAAVANDPNVDILVVNGSVPPTPEAAEFMSRHSKRQLELMQTSPVPVIPMEFLPTERTAFARRYRREQGLPFVLDSFTRGIPALAKAIWWSECRAEAREHPHLPTPVTPLSVDSARAWSEREVGEWLAHNGIPVAAQQLVTSADEAARVARETGGPFALKVSSPDILHKTDVGGVRLNLPAGDVGEAYTQMMTHVREHEPDAVIEGAVLSSMRPDGVDLVVGIVRDTVWGLTLVVGLGGVWVEVLHDTAIRAIPLSRAEIRAMFDELQSAPLLAGVRGAERVDLDLVTDVVAKLVEVARSVAEPLDALEINPLRVRGDVVEALDVLLRWS